MLRVTCVCELQIWSRWSGGKHTLMKALQKRTDTLIGHIQRQEKEPNENPMYRIKLTRRFVNEVSFRKDPTSRVSMLFQQQQRNK